MRKKTLRNETHFIRSLINVLEFDSPIAKKHTNSSGRNKSFVKEPNVMNPTISKTL